MTILRIWLSDPLDGAWPWHHSDGRMGTAVSDTDKTSLSDQKFDNLDIILPGQWVRVFEHDLPKMRDNERISAAGFFIEDKIAGPLSGQHMTLGVADDNRVGVMASEKLDAVTQALSKFGLKPNRAVADFEIFSADQTFKIGDRVITPGPLGYTQDAEWTEMPGLTAELPAALAEAETSTALNFLSGKFATRKRGSIDLSYLYRAAALLAVAGIAGLTLIFAESRATHAQATFTKDETARLYTEFTGENAPARPAQSVTRAIKRQGTQQPAGFLELSDILFTSVARLEGVAVQSVQYDKNRGQLSLRLIYPSFEAAGEMERSVSQSGGVFQPGGVREQGGRLIGTAALSLGGGS